MFSLEIIQEFENGTTIEFGEDTHGNQVHRVCNQDRNQCQWVEPWHCAQSYATRFEKESTGVSQ